MSQTEAKHWLLDIPFFKAVVIIISVIYCIAPPVLYLFTIQPELFKSLDIFKLLLMSAGFGSLLFTVCFLVILTSVALPMKKEYIDIEIYSTAIIAILGMYSIVLIFNLTNYVLVGQLLTLKQSITILAGEVGIFFLSILLFVGLRISSKK
jgi:hypothetical protein